MTPLRQRMIEEMRIRNYSEHSIAAYVSAVYRLANYYGRRPDRLSREEIRAFLVDLVQEKQVAWSYYQQVLAALRYFFRHVVRRGEVVEDIRGPRGEKKLPVVLSPAEVARFFHAIPSLKHRTVLMLAYGAGLRISEAVGLRLTDIDRERQVLRVRQGKGKKDRYTVLSPALLEMLDRYCWAAQPEDLLFTTRWKDRPITDSTLQRACRAAQQAAGLDKRIATVDKVRLIDGARPVARRGRFWKREQVPVHYLALLEKKPGGFIRAKPLKSSPPQDHRSAYVNPWRRNVFYWDVSDQPELPSPRLPFQNKEHATEAPYVEMVCTTEGILI